MIIVCFYFLQAGHSKLSQIPGKDQTIVTGNGGPSGTGKRPVGDSVLPPPVFIQDIVPIIQPKNSTSKAPVATGETGSVVELKCDDAHQSSDVVGKVINTISTPSTISAVDNDLSEEKREEASMVVDSVKDYDGMVNGFENRSVIFNGIATCAVFPVPISSFSCNIWELILTSSKDFPNRNPYESMGIPFSDLLDLTLPPVDATYPTSWSKIISQTQNHRETAVSESNSIVPSASSTLSKTSSILALRQIFPGVNMNVGVPSGASSK